MEMKDKFKRVNADELVEITNAIWQDRRKQMGDLAFAQAIAAVFATMLFLREERHSWLGSACLGFWIVSAAWRIWKAWEIRNIHNVVETSEDK